MGLVIIGGTAAGMSCAARARRLDESCEITVLEQTAHVSSASCGLPYYLSGTIAQRSSLEVETAQSLKAALNIQVLTGMRATGFDHLRRQVHAIDASGQSHDFPYDDLVLATGTHAAMPPITMLNEPSVTALRTIEDAESIRRAAKAHAGTRVLVIGAGFIGVEAAENLARTKADVTLVEASAHPLPPIDPQLATYATEALTHLGVEIHTGTLVQRLERIETDNTIRVTLSEGTMPPVDRVVIAAGIAPNTDFAEASGVACERGWIDTDEHGRTNLDHVWAAGDATLRTDRVTGVRHPLALAGPANREGRLVADAIHDPDHARTIPPALGTAIVAIGDMVISTTGPTTQQLDDAHMSYTTLRLLPSQHAGYYPGAEQLDMLVRIGADDRLLGAQIAGGAGVDKRIDVIATAITAGLRASDLIDLDLAYAPPFGSAKDPINFAGYMAQDTLQHIMTQQQPEALIEGHGDMLLLDVRTDFEYQESHIPGTLHIPHTQIRDHIDDIRAAAHGRPVLVICHSGKRAYLAHRILAQHGFESTVLAGGMNALIRLLSSQ